MGADIPENLQKITYVSSGKFVSAEEWIHPRRIIDSYEIIYVVEGCIYIQQDEEKLCVGEGGILVLQPFKTHFGYGKSTGKTSFYWVHYLDPELFTFYNIKPFSCFEDTYHINLLLKQLLHIVNTPEYPGYLASLMIWLILSELAAKQKNEARKFTPLMKDLCEWVRIHCDRKITVRDIANEFGYSEDYLARLFKKNFNMGIKEYVNEIRMNAVKNRLLSGGCPIKQIAREAGFEDYKNFLKFFKYHEEMSPAEFRKTYFNTHLNNK